MCFLSMCTTGLFEKWFLMKDVENRRESSVRSPAGVHRWYLPHMILLQVLAPVRGVWE